jgi:NADP-dependent aldehyde dehydrogenase
LIFGLEGPDFDTFTNQLIKVMQEVEAMPMLHPGIEQAFFTKKNTIKQQSGVNWLLGDPEKFNPHATLVKVTAEVFLANPLLHEEVFGPFSILVACQNRDEMYACRSILEGQLTTSFMGTPADFALYAPLIELATRKAGRVIFNGVPTGVEVADAMVHGGPSPATTDSRFTAVGPRAIYRWTRPVCWQNAPEFLLPPELKTSNELGIWRRINGFWTR